MELNSKKRDFVSHAREALEQRNLNSARKAAEAFCKIILLKEYGEDSDAVLSRYRRFNGRITYIFDEKLIDKKIKPYLVTLQTHGNISSHDDDVSKLDEDEINIGLSCLSQLVGFLYNDYFNENIPLDLKNCKHAKYYLEKALAIHQYHDLTQYSVQEEDGLKQVNKTIKKAQKRPLKKRHKLCKDLTTFSLTKKHL